MSEGVPRSLRGYTLRKEHKAGLIRKLIFLIILALILMYFFKRPWFDLIISYFKNIF